MSKTLLCALLIVGWLLTLGCASKYAPPPNGFNGDKWEAIVEQPFSVVWANLIDHTSVSSFSINHVERPSGLLSLNFAAQGSALGKYVDCGRVVSSGTDITFIEFLKRRGFRMGLTLTLNVFVRPVTASRTQVRVTARYIVSGDHRGGSAPSWEWLFDTGRSCAEVGLPGYVAGGRRTERPILCEQRTGAPGSDRWRPAVGRRLMA